MRINEQQIVPLTRPTDNQKAVLAKITAAATPQLAAADISDTPNLVAARDMLDKLGLIEIDNEGAHVTDLGREVMVNQNLATPDGQLTDDGQQAAYGDEADDAAPAPDSSMDDFGGFGEFGGFGDEEEGGDEFGDMFGDEEGRTEIDPREMDDVKEPKESLLVNIRKQVLREAQNVPVEFEAQLSNEEREQLDEVARGVPIYKFHSLYKKAYNHFVKDMPYGTAKGTSGDPGEWLQYRFAGGNHETE
jgi:hypothetical protein